MRDRKNEPAQLRRRVELLEALLATEKEAHSRMFSHYRTLLYEVTELRLRHERAQAALAGRDAC